MTKLNSRMAAIFKIDNEEGWLVPQVEAHQNRVQKKRMDPGWFHPSSLHHPCDALLAFEFLGLTKTERLDARTQRIFDMGHGRDRDWKRYLGELGLPLTKERRGKCPDCKDKNGDGRHVCLPDLRIRGSVDDIIRNPSTNRVQVFEFKTKNDALFKKLDAPDASHVTQVHPYMSALQVESTVIVYENKNTQELKEFTIGFEQERWNRIVERVQRILHQLRNGWDPERVPQTRDDECPHFNICSRHSFADDVWTTKGLLGEQGREGDEDKARGMLGEHGDGQD